jgi:Zn-dependent peptidase ImmA (M78 family)
VRLVSLGCISSIKASILISRPSECFRYYGPVPIDLHEFGSKLQRRRLEGLLSHVEVQANTGISTEKLIAFEKAIVAPTGDEVLILADFFKCDYRFFISNEQLAASEQTASLYRRFGTEFTQSDRRGILEFLFLCECEQMLGEELGKTAQPFTFQPRGTYFKAHADEAAKALRDHFHYKPNEVPSNIYDDFRRIGFHVFRRHLGNSGISGITIRHPFAGTCILVNYSEDVYRQRFTAAHEAAHGNLDSGEDVAVSFTPGSRQAVDSLVEVRANKFASRYLLPPSVASAIPVSDWTEQEAVLWASRFKVSTTALSIALQELGVIDEDAANRIARVRVPAEMKVDPELVGVPPRVEARKRDLLQRGLSTSYVNLCFEAYTRGIISGGRAAEMLLVTDFELNEIAQLFNVSLHGV